MKKKILVAGGTGYIGSHTTVELQNAGYEVVIIDDLSNSNMEVLDGIERITGVRPAFVKLDLKDKEGTRKALEAHPGIDGVILFAASKAVGDGVAVKPTDKIVVSPAAGTIVKIFNTNHAFCLETEKGAEIVVHMGIDTVALEGKGFKRLVEEGAQVSAGQPILEMDLDYLNANARSMISPVVCSNIDDFSGLIIKAQGHVVAGQTPLYEIKK